MRHRCSYPFSEKSRDEECVGMWMRMNILERKQRRFVWYKMQHSSYQKQNIVPFPFVFICVYVLIVSSNWLHIFCSLVHDVLTTLHRKPRDMALPYSHYPSYNHLQMPFNKHVNAHQYLSHISIDRVFIRECKKILFSLSPPSFSFNHTCFLLLCVRAFCFTFLSCRWIDSSSQINAEKQEWLRAEIAVTDCESMKRNVPHSECIKTTHTNTNTNAYR